MKVAYYRTQASAKQMTIGGLLYNHLTRPGKRYTAVMKERKAHLREAQVATSLSAMGDT